MSWPERLTSTYCNSEFPIYCNMFSCFQKCQGAMLVAKSLQSNMEHERYGPSISFQVTAKVTYTQRSETLAYLTASDGGQTPALKVYMRLGTFFS